MIAVIIAFLMSLLWYFFDSRKKNKQPVSQSFPHDHGVIRIDVAERVINKRLPNGELQQRPVGRVYYSTPGKTFTCFIREGRVLNTAKPWPFAPNNP